MQKLSAECSQVIPHILPYSNWVQLISWVSLSEVCKLLNFFLAAFNQQLRNFYRVVLLQKFLQVKALKAVRFRLLLPAMVPEVIKTLKALCFRFRTEPSAPSQQRNQVTEARGDNRTHQAWRTPSLRKDVLYVNRIARGHKIVQSSRSCVTLVN